MLKDKTLTYISLFSSAGVGCYGFKQEGYACIATNEFIKRRLDVQRFNDKCRFETGYICGDIQAQKTKERIQEEIQRYKKLGNDGLDVLIATPPCQGMSVANHKKTENEINRNSLVVESIIITQELKPKVFLFENVAAFLTTGCFDPEGNVKEIQQVIHEQLDEQYEIMARVINFKNYGSNSSRTRTLVIGVRKDYEEYISPIDLFPEYQSEKTLKEVIGKYKSLKWGEIDATDILHAFRTYPKEMESWIEDLKEGQSAFDNLDETKRPHKVVDGKIVQNVNKNGDKYTRQFWNKVGPCIHTRNDQLASQNTVHPKDNRVFSIRELMDLMTIPSCFKWTDKDYDSLNLASLDEKRLFYTENEIKIRQSIGEAVPTAIFQQIAHNIKNQLLQNNPRIKIEDVIKKNSLTNVNVLVDYVSNNPDNYSIALLSKIAEMANGKRTDNDAYYTNKTLLNRIYEQMPLFEKDEIRILEPSVGVGNFLPYLIKKYENIKKVVIDVNDIDNDSINLLKELIKKIKVPKNVNINFINDDFLTHDFNNKYDLVIGNPPFTKVKREEHPEYFSEAYNTETRNLCALFIEKAIRISNNVCIVEPKYILNTIEFEKTRELLSKHRINSIYDFGEKGFKGVLIETVCISLTVEAKPSKIIVKSIPFKITNIVKQSTLTAKDYPYWLLYRNGFFDEIAKKMEFGCFEVFRDRQITNKDLQNYQSPTSIRVLKSRNILNDGSIQDLPGYDSWIELDLLKNKSVYKFFNDENVYLVPNMTYNPRMTQNVKGCTVNGSVAILIPKTLLPPTKKQISYFGSDEYKRFYQIARNYQTRSLNIDETSVYFFGLLGE